MDYGDIIFDQPQNESFCDKIQSVQYKDALAMMWYRCDNRRDTKYFSWKDLSGARTKIIQIMEKI